MLEIEEAKDISVISIDDIPYAVDNLPEEVQEMVLVYNRWNREEIDLLKEHRFLSDKIMQVTLAKNAMSQRMVLAVRKSLQSETDEQDDANSA